MESPLTSDHDNTSDTKQRVMAFDFEFTGRKKRQHIKILLPTPVVARIEEAFPTEQYNADFIGMCYTLADIIYNQSYKQGTEWPSLMGGLIRTMIPYRDYDNVRSAMIENGIIYHDRHYKTSKEWGKFAHAQRFRLVPYEVSNLSTDIMSEVTSVRIDYTTEQRGKIVEGALGYRMNDEVFDKLLNRTDSYFEQVFNSCLTDEDMISAMERKEWYIKNIFDLYHGNIWHTRTRVNDRAHHNFTNLPTILLRVLQEHYDLVEFDVKNSQIALLPKMFPSLLGTRFAKDAADGRVYEKVMRELDSKDRNVGKQAVIRVLFDSEYREDRQTRAMEGLYPELMDRIRDYKDTVEKSDVKESKLAVRLQKIEAHYMLDLIYMDPRLEFVPCFTRHDSIVVPREYSHLVEKIIKEKIDFDCRIQKKWFGHGYKVANVLPFDKCKSHDFNTESFMCGATN